MPISLSVNLNKIALIRNSRSDNNPNIEDFARIALESGATGLTAHPRPDLRHIHPDDLFLLAKIADEYSVELNIEGNPFAEENARYPGLMALVREIRPTQCTLVPDSNVQLTSDHGFDMKAEQARLKPVITELSELGIRSSIFMDADPSQIDIVKSIGADRIELYTGPFATAYSASRESGKRVFDQHADAAMHAHSIDLGINAGHDLNLKNMVMYKNLPKLKEVSIGHALTADALISGFSTAVTMYSKLCE